MAPSVEIRRNRPTRTTKPTLRRENAALTGKKKPVLLINTKFVSSLQKTISKSAGIVKSAPRAKRETRGVLYTPPTLASETFADEKGMQVERQMVGYSASRRSTVVCVHSPQILSERISTSIARSQAQYLLTTLASWVDGHLAEEESLPANLKEAQVADRLINLADGIPMQESELREAWAFARGRAGEVCKALIGGSTGQTKAAKEAGN